MSRITVPNDDRADGLIEQADALENAGLLREALSKWREAVAREPSPASLCRLGAVAAELNEDHEAEQAYLAAIAAAPMWGLPHEALAILYRERGDLQKAEDYLRLSLRQERKVRTLTFLGDILERLGRYSEAEITLREALDVDPSYTEAHVLLGRVAREDVHQAISEFERALELDPNYAVAHRELGWVWRRLGKLEAAEAHVRKAIDLEKDDVWSHIYLGNILWQKGCQEEAERAFRQAIDLDPGDSTGYWCLSDLLRTQGRMSEARGVLRESLRLGVANVQATLRFGLLLRDLGEFRKARRYLKRAQRLDPQNAAARKALLDMS